jgi:hypothetical protein
MDRVSFLQMKIRMNHLKWGPIFLVVLDIIYRCNIYNLSGSAQDCQYVDLCESFFDTLIKEVHYHNYIIAMNTNNYSSLISNCIDKSIYLKDRQQYEINDETRDNLCTLLYDPISIYLIQLSNQLRYQIGYQFQSAQYNAQQPPPPQTSHTTPTLHPIQSGYQQSSQLQSNYSTSQPDKSYQVQQPEVPIHIYNRNLPDVKMQLIYPRIPVVDKLGHVTIQKNFLDI